MVGLCCVGVGCVVCGLISCLMSLDVWVCFAYGVLGACGFRLFVGFLGLSIYAPCGWFCFMMIAVRLDVIVSKFCVLGGYFGLCVYFVLIVLLLPGITLLVLVLFVIVFAATVG